MFFSIVIPTYNRATLLPNLLDSLSKLRIPTDTEWEIIIVDNNSTDSTKDVVDRHIKQKRLPLRYIFEKEQGASNARNKGIRESKGEIVAFLDDDETVDENWLAALHEGFDRFQCAGLGGKTVAQWTFPAPEWYTTEGPFRIVGAVVTHNLGDGNLDYPVGKLLPGSGNMAVKKDCFQKYGFFRNDMGPIGDEYNFSEDTEFCARLIKGGERLVYWPKALAYNRVHQERATKEYLRLYHFRLGRARAQLHQPTKGERVYFNVPRYFFRMYGEALIQFLWAVVRRNKSAVFYYRLTLNRIGGQIIQHLLEKPPGPFRKFYKFLIKERRMGASKT